MSGLPVSIADDAHHRPAPRLLVLDDDHVVRRTIALMGTRSGAQVTGCSTVAEFESMLRSFDPDVLLIDLMMPGVDGIDVISRLDPQCRASIFVMTGADKRTFEASREVLQAAGAQIAGFLHKPFSIADMRQILEGTYSKLPDRPGQVSRQSEADLLSPSQFESSAKDGRISPYFQPIFHADARRLKGFEALLRVRGRDTGSFAPQYLDQLVKNDDLSVLITDMVIDQSLAFLASLPKHADLTVSVNIFGAHAVAEGFRERLVEKCACHGVAPGRVILELSEATVFDLRDADVRKMTQLRLSGFGLSIDDFGTGNSSLGRLARLPFSELKIDKSFCLALPGSESAEAVIEACLGIARKLDMRVVAEGVESHAIAVKLASMGCDALQGHYFGRAMPAVLAADWIGQGSPRAVA